MKKRNFILVLVISIFLILTVFSPNFLVIFSRSDSVLEDATLDTNITNPSAVDYLNSLTNISGNATHETQVSNVKLRIHDESNNLYWNDSTGWRNTEQWFNATVLDGSWDETSEDWYYNLSEDHEDGLDQQNTLKNYDVAQTVGGNWWYSQSFKPTNNTISKVELYLLKEGSPPNDLTFLICDNDQSEPDENENIITPVSIAADEIGTNYSWIEIDFPDVSVTPDATYYLFINTSGGSGGNEYGWGAQTTEVYPDGQFYRSTDSGSSWTPLGGDFDFKVYGTDGFWKNSNQYNVSAKSYKDSDADSTPAYETFWYDNQSPSSDLSAITPYVCTSSSLQINGTASDSGLNASGVKNVTLYYRESNDNGSSDPWSAWTIWTNVSNPDTDPWSEVSWSFDFPDDSGYYEFYSRAYDNASNFENEPGSAQSICRYSPPTSPDVIYVDCNGAGNYTTIQDAIDNSSNGTIIYVYNGTYNENVDITKTVTIIGNSTDGVIVNASISTDHTLNVQSDNVSISKMTLTGALPESEMVYAYGLYCNGFNNGSFAYLKCFENKFGMYLSSVDNVLVRNNNISNNSDTGLYLNTVTNSNFDLNTINGNEVHDGIRIDLNCNNNNYTNNVCSYNNQNGMNFMSSANLDQIKNNTCNYNAVSGLSFVSSTNITIHNNTCNNNTNKGIYLTGYWFNACDNTITNNTCISNEYGLSLEDNMFGGLNYNNIVRNNTFYLNDYGIKLGGSTDNLIYNNYFDNTVNSVLSGSCTNNVWNTSKTSGTNIFGGNYIGGNYWGNYTGYDTDGDGIGVTNYIIGSGNVDYLPLIDANTEPLHGIVSPANESTGQKSNNLNWTISLSDPDGDLFNWSIECVGQHSNGNNEENGTKNIILTSLSYGATYTVYVNVTDGTCWINETYCFTTAANSVPVVSGVNPSNGSVDEVLNPVCNVTVSDSNGDSLDVYFYENSSGSWVFQQLNSSVISGSSVIWDNYSNASDYDTCYYWSVNVTDGTEWVNETYQFTTVNSTVTIYVDDDGGKDYTSIQAAIDNASDGDTIYVYNGIYNENLIVNKSITIIGEDASNTIVYYDQDEYIVTIDSDHVNIRNFKIRNSSSGYSAILIHSNNTNISNNILQNCGYGVMLSGDYTDNVVYSNNINNNTCGVYVYNCSNTTILSNTIENNSGSLLSAVGGIYLEHPGFTNIIGNNFFNDSITLGGSTINECCHNISNNYANLKPIYYYKNQSSDFTVPSDAGQVILVNCSNFTIDNCDISKTDAAIQIVYSDNILLNNTNITNSTYGLYMIYTNNSNISNSNLFNNGISFLIGSSYDNLIYSNNLSSDDNQVYLGIYAIGMINTDIFNNQFYNCYFGVYETFADGNKYYNNSIYNNYYGVASVFSASSEFYHNNFVNNTIHSVEGLTSNIWYNSTYLQGNYWDDYNGSDSNNDGIGDTPYDILGDDNQDLYPLMSPWSGSMPVVNVDTAEEFFSIQAAIDDSDTQDGHTITVVAGTYNENIIVNKSITLIGESKLNTIIRSDEFIDVITISSDNVSLSKFSIINSVNHSGIMLYSNNSNISYCNISNNKYGMRIIDIYEGGGHNNIIFNNSISNNVIGVEIYGGSRNNITNNRIENHSMKTYNNVTTTGLYIQNSPLNYVYDNNFYNDSIIIVGNSINNYYHEIVNNFANNKPIYYYTNETVSFTVPTNAGQIILINCTNTIIDNCNISNTDLAIYNCFSENITVNNSNFTDSFIAVYNTYTNNSNFTGNTFFNNGFSLTALGSYNNSFLNNSINSDGSNYFSVNAGIYIVLAVQNTIHNNTFNNSMYAIMASTSINNTFSSNDLTNNTYGMAFFSTYADKIFHNNFINNGKDADLSISSNTWYNQTTCQGNYWDNYSGLDSNGDGIGDTQYNISYDSWYGTYVVDSYPLMYQRTTPPTFAWVDDDYSSSTPGWNVDHFDSIQSAVENVTTGGSIYVYDGTYSESITIDKNLTINPASSVIIDGCGNVGFNITTNNTIINGFTIYNCSFGVYVLNNFEVSNITISNNTIYNCSHGILLVDSNTSYVLSNTVFNNLGNSAFIQTCNNSIISNNSFYNNSQYGLTIKSSSNCSIFLNNIHNNSDFGISVIDSSQNNSFYKNNINNNSDKGIYVSEFSSNNSLYHNNFIGNGQNANDTSNNTWYNTTLLEGNYWDDYTTQNPNATHSSNGVYDIPYIISGGNNNDSYPLVSTFENYYILSLTDVPSSVTEGNSFTVTVKTLGDSLVEGANVSIESGGYGITDSNGEVTLSAPSVSSDSSKTITATKTGYTSDNDSITVENSASGSPNNGGPPPGGSSNTAPVADAGGPYTGNVNSAITFDGSASSDEDEDTLTYTWDFGDGSTGTGETVTHIYASTGTYTVNLTVYDGSSSNTASTTVTIQVSSDLNPPSADAGGPYSGLTYENILFDGSNSYDNGTITNYTWSFGDGTTGYGKKTYHTYNSNGTFTLKLTVKDNENYTDVDTTYIIILQDTDADGWSDDKENTYGTNILDSQNYPSDNDGDKIPDDYDEDDDNDGITDNIEQLLGSDSNNAFDVHLIEVDGNNYYLVDSNKDGIFDKLYNPVGKITDAQITSEGKYLLDIDGDKKWDYVYDPESNSVSIYLEKEEPSGDLPWIPIILLIVVIIIVSVIFILFKAGFFSLEKKDEEDEETYEDDENYYHY